MILDSFRLDGRVALVSGGHRGLGQGYAVALAEAGADIALLDRSDPTETAARVRALGRRAVWVPADLAVDRAEQLAAAVDTVVIAGDKAAVGDAAEAQLRVAAGA